MPIRLTRAVKILLVTCFVTFLIQQTGDQFFGTHLTSWFALVPSAVLNHFWVWQLFTYLFVHADVMHLFFNLLLLAFMGGELEATWGFRRFLKYYFFCGLTSGLLYLVIQSLANGSGLHMPMVGASSAIYGLLMAYGLIFGERLLLFMMIFPMKAKYFVWILALIELLTTVYSSGGGVASIAHLGGMAAGFAYLWVRASLILAKKRKGRPSLPAHRKKRKGNHLRLIINNDREFDLPEDESGENPKTWH